MRVHPECEKIEKLFLALRLSGDKLWWADQGTDQIGICDKKDGGNWKVLRNSTSPMMHMKIYNETVQKGAGRLFCGLFAQLKSPCQKHYAGQMCCCDCHVEPVYSEHICSCFRESPCPPLDFCSACVFGIPGTNLCSHNNGDCSQLCLPTSPTTRACMCTAGYSLRTGQQSCEGKRDAHTHFQRPKSGLSYFISSIHLRLKTVVCLLLQVSALSCSTLCMKAYEVFLWTHQTSLMPWSQCRARLSRWE